MSTLKHKAGSLILALVAALLSVEAQAAKIVVNFEAEVTYLQDAAETLQSKVKVGDTFRGTYAYESTTLDTNLAPTVGDYWHSAPGYGISVELNGLKFRTDPAFVDFLVEIVNDHSGRDNYLLRSYNNLFDVSAPGSEGMDNHIAWQLDDVNALALNSDRLPVRPPYLPDWQSVFGLTIVSQGQGGPNSFFIRARVNKAVRVL